MNDYISQARRPDREGISRTAVNPSMEAAGKTSCFSRSGKCLPDPTSFKRSVVHEPRRLAAQQALELRHDLEQVADQADIGHFKDRRFAVLVDGHDGARVLDARQMLDCAGNADGDVEFGGYDLARLTHLHFVRRIPGIDGGT